MRKFIFPMPPLRFCCSVVLLLLCCCFRHSRRLRFHTHLKHLMNKHLISSILKFYDCFNSFSSLLLIILFAIYAAATTTATTQLSLCYMLLTALSWYSSTARIKVYDTHKSAKQTRTSSVGYSCRRRVTRNRPKDGEERKRFQDTKDND